MISKELADKNNLSVGDKITFQEFETGKAESTFTIVGIYSGTEGTTKQAITPDGIPANSGYIDMDGLKKFYDGVNEKLEDMTILIFIRTLQRKPKSLWKPSKTFQK